ncbi:MAG TPA: N-acetylmuramoyl-L-alanine amidase [Thermoanaerobaculia bacterium]|nr:N-acetylmuramoyl-L-alanine amidase [Thermoanaerobaculia bacterium]
MGKKGTIVIDPGHGGSAETGGSSPNNATSPSGVLEKNVTLGMAFLVREALAKEAQAGNHQLKVVLTRDSDVNLGLKQRAETAKTNNADLFLSIHCNASDSHKARGVETLVRPKSAGNTNHADDKALAQAVQNAVFNAIQAHDPKTKDRGVKDQVLGVLKDEHLGGARGCLVELEFIDRTDVDTLLNIGPDAPAVRADIARAIAKALIAIL